MRDIAQEIPVLPIGLPEHVTPAMIVRDAFELMQRARESIRDALVGRRVRVRWPNGLTSAVTSKMLSVI